MVLKHTLAAIPAGGTNRHFGTAYFDGETWWANVGGNNLGARWLDPIVPVQGEKIAVDITTDGTGQSSALVIGSYTDQPRPGAGTVLTAGTTELVVTGAFGGNFLTDRFIGSYSPGDPVVLLWDSSTPVVVGKLGIPTQAPEGIAPPMPPGGETTSGTVKARAIKTNTWVDGFGWGNFAGSQNGGEQVYSGNDYGTTTGAMFYGNAFNAAAGKTVTEIRLRIPKRLNVGTSGSAQIHVYVHNSRNQPSGNVNRISGPYNFTVKQAEGAHWVVLPLAAAAGLVAGGGLAIYGNPYVGFNGRLKDIEAWRIEMDWT